DQSHRLLTDGDFVLHRVADSAFPDRDRLAGPQSQAARGDRRQYRHRPPILSHGALLVGCVLLRNVANHYTTKMSAEVDQVSGLLAQARAGDAAARDRLFARCRDYLGLAARARVETWLRAKVDASDLVQQTLMEAHRGFGRFQGATEAEWLAWLRRILDNN